MKFSATLLMFVPLEPVLAQNSGPQAARQFDYDPHAPLDIKEIAVQDRAGVAVHDITYASPKGGVVPA
jgi:hypothetical protein